VSFAAREATNDQPDTYSRPAQKPARQATGGKGGRTTQADIDALFS
jgi:hypothetical protein